MTGRTLGRTGVLAVSLAIAFGFPLPARSQCDESALWSVFAPTGDVAEILVQGNIAWIGADGGVIRIDGSGVASGNPDQIKISDKDGLISTDVSCMAFDSFGNVWVGTQTSGVSVFDSQGVHLADLTSFEELYSDFVTAMASAGDRMFILSVDRYAPSGAPEGGGGVIVQVTQRPGGGYDFERLGLNFGLEVGQSALASGSVQYFGTNGLGLWRRDESVQPPGPFEFLTQAGGLLSNNVKTLLEAPFPGAADDVLWIGTGSGLQAWNGDSLTTVDVVSDATTPGIENIIDLARLGSTLYALVEVGSRRSLYSMDLDSSPLVAGPLPKSSCLPDSNYIPREVAVDSAGRIYLGTRRNSFSVMEGGAWYCPRPLGPHAPQAADIVVGADGGVYFGTGDRTTDTRPGVGLGVFKNGEWSSVTADIVEREVVFVDAWPDSTIWMGTSVDRNFGGVNRYFPSTGAIETYHPATVAIERRTLGRNVGAFFVDPDGNLWILYGQQEGGISIIEPNLTVTNFPMNDMIPGGNDLLTSIGMDSRGRAWVGTRNTDNKPGQLHVIDVNGTPGFVGDDSYDSFLLASEVADIGNVWDIVITDDDEIWLIGDLGLAVGAIGPDFGGEPFASWTTLSPTAIQLGGRNPQPYSVAEIDWDGNIWIGTETSGLVRVSPGTQTWTWYDQVAGCPLTDQSITGLAVDEDAKVIWISTLTGGVARLDLSNAVTVVGGDRLDPQAYPNPYRPDRDGDLRFGALPNDRTLTLRIYTLVGELVHETEGVDGTATWDGRNASDQVVEPGVYLVTAIDSGGDVYEGKVAILR